MYIYLYAEIEQDEHLSEQEKQAKKSRAEQHSMARGSGMAWHGMAHPATRL